MIVNLIHPRLHQRLRVNRSFFSGLVQTPQRLMAHLGWLSCLLAPTVFAHNITLPQDPHALYAFLEAMPKGGELHYHLAGGAYAEPMLAEAANHPWCLETHTQRINTQTNHCQGILTQHLKTHKKLVQRVINAWSLRDYHGLHAHDHFFDSFFKFLPVIQHYPAPMLASVLQRAARQHELYMEIMILPDNGDAIDFAPRIHHLPDYASKQRALLNDPAFVNNIDNTIKTSRDIREKTEKILRCHQAHPDPACQITFKFQTYVLREQSADSVFAQALNAFVAVTRSPELVGVNLVQPEDGELSLKNYTEHMRIFQFLHQAYPQVHIALHAGELSTDLPIPAHHLRSHIQDAIRIGQAQRIGHGVDLAYEDNKESLLDWMARVPVPVEINLTSNQRILHVEGDQHPLRLYLSHHVPVVLSTDDEGILRTDLTQQYVMAVKNHHLNYTQLKQINRNALTYSFLPGQSLWAQPDLAIRVPVCRNQQHPRCLRWLKSNPKARLQWTLEQQLERFELSHGVNPNRER